MNLLFLTYQGDLAGSTNSIAYLSKGLAERGHTVVVGCRRTSLLFELLQESKVIAYPMTFRHKLDGANRRQIRDVVHQYQIDLINAQSSIDRYTSIFAKWQYKLSAKLVHTRRQTPKSVGGFLQNWFYVKGTDKIVCISPQLKQTFVNKGFPSEHIQVIYNGLPAERFQQFSDDQVLALRQKYDLSPDDLVIGCVSRLKNQEQLIRALPYLPASIKVLFVGIQKGHFDELVQSLQIPNPIIYAGKVSGKEVMNYYKLMQVKVLPSTMDGFGLVLVEAMGMGTPVVGTRYEGIIDVLDEEKNGLWFEDDDVQTLAEKINTVLFNQTERTRLIENGKKAAFGRFSLQHTIDHYERFFEQLIGK